MKGSTVNGPISHLLNRLDLVTREASNRFATLTEAQLNWKPRPDAWSVAECLHHLITTNTQYLTTFASLHAGTYNEHWLHRLPARWHRFWGRLLIRHLGPEVRNRSKSPAAFRPSASRLPVGLVDDFARHQQQLKEAIVALYGLNLQQTIITSPASAWVTYSLHDALLIIAGHEERHLNQAKRVTAHNAFPAA